MHDNTETPIKNLARIIVDRRNLLFLFYFIAIIFCLFSITWVEVENDIVNYLDETTKTRQGIEIMETEFTTFAMADLMVSNIPYATGEILAEQIENIDGVSTLMFENNESHFKDTSALMIIIFDGEEKDPRVLQALDDIHQTVAGYDYSLATEVGVDPATELTNDMTIVGILGVAIGILVLLFTSKSYIEIPILLMTFGVAALLNMGTNFALGKISYISNSVGVVLQLALAIDYAIILIHRFTEEYEVLPAREAAIEALSKAIPEIASSSLTTIGGLGALAFMNFGIGLDLATVMIKAILFSMLSVFTLMPGILVVSSKLMDKTRHRSFVPSVAIIGRFSIKTRYIIPPIFVVVLVAAFIFSSKCPFLFSMTDIRGNRISETQMAADRIEENFGHNNMLALVVPSGDYKKEKELVQILEGYAEVDLVTGLANTEAMGGYMLGDPLTPRQFAELIDLDYEVAQLLYSAYALNDQAYGNVISGIGHYKVALIDMFQFLYEEVVQGYLAVEDELVADLEEANKQLSFAEKQMVGENYSRIILAINLPEESPETYDFIHRVYAEASEFYPYESIFLVGESSNALDLSLTFDNDNLIISILSVLFVIIILTFTFQSAGLPFILISVIQASIWINFSFPYLRNQGLYFLGFLIVTSIQMGANIDYAIVITSRFFELKKEMSSEEAIIQALDQGFPTVITSGTILAVAGNLIGLVSTDGATAVLGAYLGQGTIISIILVIFVLPQLLYLGDRIVEKTSFKIKGPELPQRQKGRVQVDGHIKGYVVGKVEGQLHGTIEGEIRPLEGGKDHEKK